MKSYLRTRALAFIPAACALWLVLTPADALAQKVSADKKGNLIYSDAAGKSIQLTRNGKDSDPCLDPAGHRIVFVREIADKTIPSGSGEAQATELRIMDIDGKNQELLVRSAEGKKPEDILAGFASPTFSPDGGTVYFSSAAWAVSGAIHAYDLKTKSVRYVLPGNNPLVVPAGEYKGHLLVEQHRYFVGGGSYDWFWLFTSEGKEVGPIGETTDNFRELYFGGK